MSTHTVNTANPPKLADGKTERLEKLWVEFLAKEPNEEDLFEIVRMVPPLADRALILYKAINPDEGTLRRTLGDYCVGPDSKPKFALLLVDLYPNESNFLLALYRVPSCAAALLDRAIAVGLKNEKFFTNFFAFKADEFVLEKVSRQLLVLAPTISNYQMVMRNVPNMADEMIRAMLAREDVTDAALGEIIRRRGIFQATALELAKSKGFKSCSVSATICYFPEKRLEATDICLGPEYPQDELIKMMWDILKNVPERRHQLAKKLDNVKICNNSLYAIISIAPELTGWAMSKMQPEPRDARTVYGEMLSVVQGRDKE